MLVNAHYRYTGIRKKHGENTENRAARLFIFVNVSIFFFFIELQSYREESQDPLWY
jgi:hypothetical protein